jgi:hypothetical protein
MTCPMLSYSARSLFVSICRYDTMKQVALFVVELYLKWVLLSEITFINWFFVFVFAIALLDVFLHTP